MKRYQKYRRYRAWVRAAGIIPAVLIIVSGVTFAALQSQHDTLTGNSIETATANLQVSTDGTNFSNTRPGFDFNNIVPGGSAMPVSGYPFYLRNAGGTPLTLKMAVASTPTNLSNVDLSKVNVILTTVGSGTAAQSFTLQSLIAAAATGGLPITGINMGTDTIQQYKLQVSMASDAVSASSASLSNIDFDFSGTAVSS